MGGKESRKGLDWAELDGSEADEPGLGTGKCLATRDGVCAPTPGPAKARSFLEHAVKATRSPEGIPAARTGRSERSAFLWLGMHCPELLRGKQEAELTPATASPQLCPSRPHSTSSRTRSLGLHRAPRQRSLLPHGRGKGSLHNSPRKGLEGTSEAGHRAPSAARSSQRADAPSAVDLWTLA